MKLHEIIRGLRGPKGESLQESYAKQYDGIFEMILKDRKSILRVDDTILFWNRINNKWTVTNENGVLTATSNRNKAIRYLLGQENENDKKTQRIEGPEEIED